jgi:hypothetical protein
LRIAAATSLLKLGRLHDCDSLLTLTDRMKLMLTIQDVAWQVRDEFIEKLTKYLHARLLPFGYMAFLFMAAHEPDSDIKLKVLDFIGLVGNLFLIIKIGTFFTRSIQEI